MKLPARWILALATLTTATVAVATLTLIAAWPALAAEAAPCHPIPTSSAGALRPLRSPRDSQRLAQATPWPRSAPPPSAHSPRSPTCSVVCS